MIAWNFQRIVGTCQFRVPWFGYPCGYSSLTAYPCSFDNQLGKYRVSLENKQIEEIWNGVEFEHFRNIHLQKCNICKDSNICSYGCGLKLGIELC